MFPHCWQNTCLKQLKEGRVYVVVQSLRIQLSWWGSMPGAWGIGHVAATVRNREWWTRMLHTLPPIYPVQDSSPWRVPFRVGLPTSIKLSRNVLMGIPWSCFLSNSKSYWLTIKINYHKPVPCQPDTQTHCFKSEHSWTPRYHVHLVQNAFSPCLKVLPQCHSVVKQRGLSAMSA